MVIVSLSRNIREASALGVVQALPTVSELQEVACHRLILILWSFPYLREATGGERDGVLWLDKTGAAN